jgi:2-polyprenyl-3-methyl-5-hydroxy-6-metoxy-1,4-benzoquinol methylase
MSAVESSPGATGAFDDARAEAFMGKIVDTLNAGALCLMTSIGHRTGLFDTMARLDPATSDQIAEAAGLQERYVREWLAAMTVGGIVTYDAATAQYHLPAEHAACLTRGGGTENLAVFAQHVPLLGTVEEDVLSCFRHGGGVPYSRFRRFHEVMAEDSGQTILPALEDHILPLVPGLTDRLERGIRVFDAGCGRGLAVMAMAARFPNSRFTGVDLCEDAIGYAKAEAARRGLDNARFEVRDLSDFDETAETGAFDFVTTFDAVHDQAKPRALLRGIRRALAEGGSYLAQDINGSSHLHHNLDHLAGPLLYTISCMHCMTVSLAQGGDGLGTLWGREAALEMFAECGFRDVTVHELPHDSLNCYYVCQC